MKLTITITEHIEPILKKMAKESGKTASEVVVDILVKCFSSLDKNER